MNPRLRAFEALFERIATTRMAGVALLHPGLSVQAVGFQREAGGTAQSGILVTPWFMNLVRLPLSDDPDELPGAVGSKRHLAVGSERFEFIAAHEEGFGAFEACSLFSPMFDFADQAAAVATAAQVLEQLRRPVEASRRALLFGRGA